MERKNMKRIVCILLTVLVLTVLTGCGSDSKDADGNARITSKWKLIEMSVNGSTDTDETFLAMEEAPKFTCDDGKTFVFSNMKKSHSGKLQEDEDGYTLKFDDKTVDMKAVIDGDKLTITIPNKTTKLVFEAE